MNDEQKLYPQLIYRINSKLSEVKIASGIIDEKDSEKNKRIIAPSVFNPYGRNFHWLVVAGDKWEFSEKNDEWFGNIKDHISNKSDQWKKFKEKYHGSKDKIEIKSIEESFNVLDIIAAKKNKDEYHHALLTAFQFYPVSSHKYIDGIIYRNLVRRADYRSDKSLSNHKIDYAIAELLIDEDKTATYKLYPWARVYFHGGMPETKYSCQEDNYPWYPDVLPDIETDSIPPIKDKEYYLRNRSGQFSDDQKFPLTPADKIEDSFYYNYFLPFFAGYQEFKTDKFLELKPKYFKHFKHIIIAPLYDAYIDGKYYGNLCGTLQIPFKAGEEKNQKEKESKEPRELTEFKQNNLKELISSSHLLTSEIKESAIFEVLQQQIGENTDLLEHFIKYITLVQDWERIMVWKYDEKADESKPELVYCYKRDKDNKWDRCKDVGNNAKCKECKPSFDQLKDWIKNKNNKNNKHLPIAESGFNNKNAKRKALLKNIFSTKLIPDLYPGDEKKYENTHLIFEYPCYTVFPKDEKKDHKLGLHYERQQIDILRQMALQLKVKRETMKHGTKAAVAAIMSRNMSHNIGSHAISLWNIQLNEQLKDKSDADQGNEPLKSVKDSKDLFQYLQHRMDFIAEVSTSIPGSEMTMNFKNDIMQPFIDQKVLFKNIAASEGIEVTIENKDVVIPEDCERVSIPNGIIGTHAVYSIFENFIRNAAKHYKGTGAGFKIKVELKIPSSVRLKNKAKDWDNGNYKIVNNILTVKKNSDETTHILTKKEQDEIKTKFNEYADKNILDRFFFIHEHYIEMHIWDMRCNSCDKVSVDDKTTTVVEKLREYLDMEKSGKFIDEEGRLQAGGWGFKEMITSANFLRKNPTDQIIEQMDEKEPPLMQIICGDEGNELACKDNDCHRADEHKNKLGVLFYLRKPKDMLVFGEGLADKITKDKFEIEAAAPASWPQKDGKLTKDIPHRLLLVPDENSKKKHTNDPKAPMRIMPYKANGEVFNDDYYLKRYEEFIKGDLNAWEDLPKLCYAGGGKEFANVCGSNKKYISEDCEPADCLNNGNILFYYHASDAGEAITVKGLVSSRKYFQPVSASYSSINKLENLHSDELYQKHFMLELIESALTRVIIIDERISDFAKGNAFHGISNSAVLENMKIHVIDIVKKDVKYDDLIRDIKGIGGTNNKQRHFLVIHQGILDKIGEDDSKKLLQTDNCNCRWKIIDSGRGVPPEIEHFRDVRFVETSALLKMIETYDKHALVQTLFSLRRPTIGKET